MLAAIGQIRLEDAPLDLLAHALDDLRRQTVAQQVDRLGQAGARLGAEEIDRIRLARQRGVGAERPLPRRRLEIPVVRPLLLVRGQHPRGLLADAPQQVVDGVAHAVVAQDHLEDGAREHAALGEVGALVVAPLAGMLELAVERVGRLREGVQIGRGLAQHIQHDGRRGRSAQRRAQVFSGRVDGQELFEFCGHWLSQGESGTRDEGSGTRRRGLAHLVPSFLVPSPWSTCPPSPKNPRAPA